jgi:hypothetical protein
MRRLLLLAPLAIALAACGGGGSEGSGNPLLDAADATVEAGSELTATTASVTYPNAKIALKGEGGYNHATDEGWQHMTLTVPTGTGQMDQVFLRSALWMKSADIFGSDLPADRPWLKFDSNTANSESGFNFKGLMGQTPADVLKQLQRTDAAVTEVGTAMIDGVETTHYRAKIDPKKVPKADNLQRLSGLALKPIDVWVDGDDLVRQVRFDYTTRVYFDQPMRARVRMTMKLSDFGATVDVEPPPAKSVVDATEDSGQTG